MYETSYRWIEIQDKCKVLSNFLAQDLLRAFMDKNHSQSTLKCSKFINTSQA